MSSRRCISVLLYQLSYEVKTGDVLSASPPVYIVFKHYIFGHATLIGILLFCTLSSHIKSERCLQILLQSSQVITKTAIRLTKDVMLNEFNRCSKRLSHFSYSSCRFNSCRPVYQCGYVASRIDCEIGPFDGRDVMYRNLNRRWAVECPEIQ